MQYEQAVIAPVLAETMPEYILVNSGACHSRVPFVVASGYSDASFESEVDASHSKRRDDDALRREDSVSYVARR